MKASIVVAQLPLTWDVEENLAAITGVVDGAQPDDMLLLPEGALSGYGGDLSVVDGLDPMALARATGCLAEMVRHRGVHLVLGSLVFDQGSWFNAALYLPPRGTGWTYRKINLAVNERGRIEAGSELRAFPIQLAGGPITVAAQICREIRFPEQWQHLADIGAQAFLYLTHAANPAEPPGVWRSHLISRAAENQRFVLAANVADPCQHCPTVIISPRGEVLAELTRGETGVLKTTIDFDEATDWYLGQRRQDIVKLSYRTKQRCQTQGT